MYQYLIHCLTVKAPHCVLMEGYKELEHEDNL